MELYYRFESKNMVKNNRKVNILRIFHKSNTSAVLPSKAQTLEAEKSLSLVSRIT